MDTCLENIIFTEQQKKNPLKSSMKLFLDFFLF